MFFCFDHPLDVLFLLKCFSIFSRILLRKMFLIFSHSADVRAKFDASNVAFTTDELPLHGDLPYLDYQPGVSSIRLLVVASGNYTQPKHKSVQTKRLRFKQIMENLNWLKPNRLSSVGRGAVGLGF